MDWAQFAYPPLGRARRIIRNILSMFHFDAIHHHCQLTTHLRSLGAHPAGPQQVASRAELQSSNGAGTWFL